MVGTTGKGICGVYLFLSIVSVLADSVSSPVTQSVLESIEEDLALCRSRHRCGMIQHGIAFAFAVPAHVGTVGGEVRDGQVVRGGAGHIGSE